MAPSVHPLYSQCEDCGTFVLGRAPAADALRGYYSLDGYWREHQRRDCGFPPIEVRAVNDFQDRIPVWHELLAQAQPQSRSMLEIGCAHGGFLHYCQERGVGTVVGVEVDEETCRFARERFGLAHVCAGLFPEVRLPVHRFDAIAGFDVLEHFREPLAAMQEVARLLKPEGVFLFQTPCYRGEGQNWSQFKPAEHLFLYNARNVRQLFDRAGLRITHVLPGYFSHDMFLLGARKNSPGARALAARALRLNAALTTRFVEYGPGFHAAEGDWRWLDQQATLHVHRAVLPKAVTLRFALTCGDLWCYGGQPFEVALTDGTEILSRWTFNANQQRHEAAVKLEPGQEAKAWIFRSSASFVPHEVRKESPDQRRLAIRISNLALEEGSHDAVPLSSQSSSTSVVAASRARSLELGRSAKPPFPRTKVSAHFAKIIKKATAAETLRRLYHVFSRMEPSAAQPPDNYRDAERLSNAGFCSAKQVLAALFEVAAPKNYLEIGTRRGHSLCLAACSAPVPFDIYSFDLWIPDYGGEPNPGPDLVRSELGKFGFRGKFNAFCGDSKQTVVDFFDNPANPQIFDVIYVDGDHSDEGARTDLENTVPHLAPGGFLFFDDITHPQHLTLLDVWNEFAARHPELEDTVETRYEYGWALARRRTELP